MTSFKTIDGTIVPTVTAEQMRRIDEVAAQEFGIDLLQMMENAGRNLAQQAMDMLGSEPSKAPILIAAGAGGNGGGGLCCARHLHNRGCSVVILLDRDPDLFQGAPRDAASRLIEGICRSGKPVLSLDIPSGTDATTGEISGQVVRPSRTLTLALPKAGLSETPGDLYLADIGLPPELFRSVGISFPQIFQNNDTVKLFKN